MSPAFAALGPDTDDSNGVDVPTRGIVIDHYEATRVDAPSRLSVVGLAE